MSEFNCLGNCDSCTLECATAEVPKDESVLDEDEYIDIE